jgi:replicative DNA helicase
MNQKANVIPLYQQQQQFPAEAEQSVLGAILLDSGLALGPVADLLIPDDFQNAGNREIYSTCLLLAEKGNPVDLVTVATALNQAGKLEAVGPGYLAQLTDNVGTAQNCQYWAQIVHDASVKRRMAVKLKEILAFTDRPITDMAAFMDRVEERIFEIVRSHNGKAIQLVGEAVSREYSRLEDSFSRRSEKATIPTGFDSLDRLIIGLNPSETIILAGRPGKGKTALAMNIAMNTAKRGKQVGFFSLEMSLSQLSRRLLSHMAEIDAYKINGLYLSEKEWAEMAEANVDLNELSIYVDDTPSLTIQDIRGRARRLKSKNQLDLVIVDYLQIMDAGKGRSREQEISKISSGLKAMAKELKIPVVVLSQLNREVEKRTNKKPTLADLRESGAIEQDADMVIFLWQKDDKDPLINIDVAKNRNGRTGDLKLVFQKAISKFENYVE